MQIDDLIATTIADDHKQTAVPQLYAVFDQSSDSTVNLRRDNSIQNH